MDADADPASQQDSEQAADRGEDDSFSEKLNQDLLPPCPKCLADADLTRALGHRDHHDRHHADAADHQRNGGNRDQHQKDPAADAIPDLQDGILGSDVEVVLLVELETVADPHDLFDFRQRLVSWHVLVRQDDDGRGVPDVESAVVRNTAVDQLVGRLRYDDKIVLIADHRWPLLEDADDRVFDGADAHLLADGIEADLEKQRLVRIVAEDDHALPVLDFRRSKEPAVGHRHEVDVAEFFRRSDHRQLSCPLAAVEDPLLRLAAVTEPDIDGFH